MKSLQTDAGRKPFVKCVCVSRYPTTTHLETSGLLAASVSAVDSILCSRASPGHPVLHPDQDRHVAVEGRGRRSQQPRRYHANDTLTPEQTGP